MNDDSQIMYMLGKIEQRCAGIEDHLNKLNSKVAKHEADLTGIKLTSAKIGGIILVVTGILAVAWSIIVDYLKSLAERMLGS